MGHIRTEPRSLVWKQLVRIHLTLTRATTVVFDILLLRLACHVCELLDARHGRNKLGANELLPVLILVILRDIKLNAHILSVINRFIAALNQHGDVVLAGIKDPSRVLVMPVAAIETLALLREDWIHKDVYRAPYQKGSEEDADKYCKQASASRLEHILALVAHLDRRVKHVDHAHFAANRITHLAF